MNKRQLIILLTAGVLMASTVIFCLVGNDYDNNAIAEETSKTEQETEMALIFKKGTVPDITKTKHADEGLESAMLCEMEVETESETETTMATETSEEPSENTTASEVQRPLYTVQGVLLGAEYQYYIYDTLASFGHSDYMPYFICQIWQESRFEPGVVSANGSYGFGQLNYTIIDAVKSMSGYTNADPINNPYDNLYLSMWLMCWYLDQTGNDYARAISAYGTGSIDIYRQDYVDRIYQWIPYETQIN